MAEELKKQPSSPVGMGANPDQDTAATASVLAEARQEAASKVFEAIAHPEATYGLTDPKDFAQFLENANIRLVRAKFLSELVLQKRPLLRRQEMESEAFVANGRVQTALVSHQEVQSWAAGSHHAIICSISHAWETREHPDPCRYQLQHIVNWVGLYELAFEAEAWVFYDYASLFQFERSSEEESSYQAAMENAHLEYAHECTLTLRIGSLTPVEVWEGMKSNETELIPVYDKEEKRVKAKPLKDLIENRVIYLRRGWCMAELEWSSLRSGNAQHQEIDKVKDSESDENLNGRIPLTPETFSVKMKEAKFTHRSDEQSVIHLQEKIFFEKVTACEDLVLQGLPAEQILAFAEALPLYGKLRRLTLRNVRCGQEEAKFFGKALSSSAVEMVKVDNSEQVQAGPLQQIKVQESARESALCLVKAVAEALKLDESFNKSLTHIDLRGNQMEAKGTKALLEALKYNMSVTHIDLAFNEIGHEGAKALAEILKSNHLVTFVDLCGVQTDDYSTESSHSFCTSGIGVEGAKALAEALKHAKSLTHINLANADIGPEGAEALAEALAVNAIVTHIDWSWNEIENDGAKALAKALASNTSVTHINLRENYIETKGAKALAKALASNTSVTHVNLRENHIGRKGAKAFIEALELNTCLAFVDLSMNEIGDEDAQALEEALKRNRPTTTTTKLEDGSGNQRKLNRTPFDSPIRFEALAKAFRSNASVTNISKIDLEHSNIGKEEVKALAEALKSNTLVTNINLWYNHLGPEGAKALAEALKIHTSTTEINLDHNAIGSEGAQALAQALKSNTSVTKIDLSENAIGNEGAKALAEALKINTSVTFIGLRDNAIGSKGAQALAEALKSNTSVTHINLSHAAIGPEGAKAWRIFSRWSASEGGSRRSVEDQHLGDMCRFGVQLGHWPGGN